MATPEQNYRNLIAAARHPQDVVTIALAGVIALRTLRKPPYDVPIAGLDRLAMDALKQQFFPAMDIDLHASVSASDNSQPSDEFSDLVGLLLEHRSRHDEQSLWLAHAIATASMADNHLWQDMGLPNRATLSELMASHFTPLASRNTGDMKWKKFFYRELCAREGLTLCRAPSCGVCADQPQCFGPEDSASGSFLLYASSRPSSI
ncbi:MAG: nifQ [Burkholderiaceae bacterium]|nr:nifQ [Burkholderiaceae bacterium]